MGKYIRTSISHAFFFALKTFILSYILGYIFQVLFQYLALPALCRSLPVLSEHFESLSLTEKEDFYILVYEACVFAAFVILFVFFAASNDVRRAVYISELKTPNLEKAGKRFFFHYREHWQTELLINLFILGFSALFCFVITDSPQSVLRTFFGVSPFSLIYRAFGIPQGIFAGVLFTALLQLAVILPTQRRWFVNYFVEL